MGMGVASALEILVLKKAEQGASNYFYLHNSLRLAAASVLSLDISSRETTHDYWRNDPKNITFLPHE